MESELHKKWVHLTSHGPGSSLVNHTCEVAECATERWEVIAAICHDIGKSHPKWQKYAETFASESPFNHAACGGIICYYILLELVGEKEAWAGLHSLAAHHSYLDDLEGCQIAKEVESIAGHKQCKEFAGDLLKIFAGVPKSVTENAFKRTRELVNSPLAQGLNPPNQKTALEATLLARDLLGRLCLFDHRSAAHQDPKSHAPFTTELPSQNIFCRRKTKKEFSTTFEINSLRSKLLEETLALPLDKKYYVIPAPTGTGKTNAALSLAEILCESGGLERIVYACPLTSIGDQVLSDYLSEEGNNAQIWNYKRKETAMVAALGTSDRKHNEEGYAYLENEEAILESPFSRSFNITTTNQVVLALLHPHRTYCINKISLRNSVIILDEYHKIPKEILQGLLEVLDKQENTKVIFLSATPSEESIWEPRQHLTATLSENLLKEFETSEIIGSRRSYRKERCRNAEDIAHMIKEHNPADGDALIMLNLIGEGTSKVAELCDLNPDPYFRAQNGEKNEHGATIWWLDGTLPPALRETIIKNIKASRHSGHLLLCTPIIQAGCDLDFDFGWCDWESINSLIQTGGRVGRNTCGERTLHCFELVTSQGKTTHQVLEEYAIDELKKKYPQSWEDNLAKKIQETRSQQKENEGKFFQAWGEGETLSERELLKKQRETQKTSTSLPSNLLELTTRQRGNYIGLNLSSWEALATLFGEQNTTQVLIIPEDYKMNEITHTFLNDTAKRIKLEQQYLARTPKSFLEYLKNNGFCSISTPKGDIWQKNSNHI
jgi:CRISPR-associated endonuclease Cas3-HD